MTDQDLTQEATEWPPRIFALYYPTGVFMGLWDDEKLAADLLVETPGATVKELVPAIDYETLSATLRALSAERDKFQKGWSMAVDQCDKEYARAKAAEARLNEAAGILNALLKEASITSNRGAVTGSHWTHLGVAILKARAFLASLEGDKPDE